MAVVRRERSTWASRVQTRQQEWQRSFVAQNGRVPTPTETQAHAQFLEEDAIDMSLDVFREAMDYVSRNPGLLAGSRVEGNVNHWLTNLGGTIIGFEHAVDLVYHWLKHARPGQTIAEYLQEANRQLDDAVRNGTATVGNDRITVQTPVLTLVVTIRSGVAYLTTFYYKD